MFRTEIQAGDSLTTAIHSTAKSELTKGIAKDIGKGIVDSFQTFGKIRSDQTRSKGEQNHLILARLKPKVDLLSAKVLQARYNNLTHHDNIKKEM